MEMSFTQYFKILNKILMISKICMHFFFFFCEARSKSWQTRHQEEAQEWHWWEERSSFKSHANQNAVHIYIHVILWLAELEYIFFYLKSLYGRLNFVSLSNNNDFDLKPNSSWTPSWQRFFCFFVCVFCVKQWKQIKCRDSRRPLGGT